MSHKCMYSQFCIAEGSEAATEVALSFQHVMEDYILAAELFTVSVSHQMAEHQLRCRCANI